MKNEHELTIRKIIAVAREKGLKLVRDGARLAIRNMEGKPLQELHEVISLLRANESGVLDFLDAETFDERRELARMGYKV